MTLGRRSGDSASSSSLTGAPCPIDYDARDMRETGSFPIWNGASFLHETERGALRMWLTAPTTLVMQYRGYSDAGYMDFVEDVWARTLEESPEKLQIFADTEHQTGFAHGFRTGMVSWNKRIVGRTDTYCLLVKSRWVAMGIAIVRATLGGPSRHAEVTTSREVFHSRLDATVRRLRPRYELIIGAGGAGLEGASVAANDGSAASSGDGSDVR